MLEVLDDMTGSFRMRTKTGSNYLICLEKPRHIVRFVGELEPTPDYAKVSVSELRKDAESIPLLKIIKLEVGQRGMMLLDVVGGGLVVTSRDTSEIVEISPL
ncbi:hypothetical protein [Paenarthrobacter sp. FR1]|uniref:hypothetical protein n=1 Tax=Paenarthrobacter sp. FR1 TaxID=3439548 RepID=UPI003DA49017